MGLEYIQNYYKVPAEEYREILFEGRKGVIIGSKEQYILVRLYDDKKLDTKPYHPIWHITYLDTFNTKPPKAKNQKSKERYADYRSYADVYDMTFFEYLKSEHCLK